MTSNGGSFWTSGSVPLIEPEFLSSIIAAASDLALVVSAEGVILSVVVNSSDDSLGNLDHWEGRPVAEFLTNESIVKFEDVHGAYLAGNMPRAPMEITHSDNAVWQYPVRYTFHRFGQDDAVLLLGRDLRPIAETQQQLVQAQIALEQGYEVRREFDLRYRVMLSTVEEAVMFVTLQTGRIEDGNARAASMLGLTVDAMVGTAFGSLFEGGSTEVMDRLTDSALTEVPEPLTLRSARTKTSVQVVPHLFRASGQRVVLCRLKGEAAEAQQADKSNRQVLNLFRRGVDAMVFSDAKGIITSVNDAFLDLSGVPSASGVVGRSLSVFLGRGQVDMGVLVDNAVRSGRMRLYATKLINELGTRLPVEVSTTRLSDAENAPLGFILRDVSQVETVRTPLNGQSVPEANRNVVELVGSASLKDIVAETTDVVEKMCIETAVSLTNNNRVAAADMLGLSRQSLYVKLRKYGLLNKNG
ncbi:MAG: transcriptional regulator PpsR [Pseudomonadota bacterium]